MIDRTAFAIAEAAIDVDSRGARPKSKDSNMRTPRHVIVAALINAGYSIKETAHNQKLSEGAVRLNICRARRAGIFVDYPATVSISNLPRHVRIWLESITPEGARVEQVIRSIILDAYAEENDVDR